MDVPDDAAIIKVESEIDMGKADIVFIKVLCQIIMADPGHP